ncbi:hypothetical protein RCG23_05855 [Neobacillus sp. PS3-34]|uniref:hypothetical protein n=1 Tax=Neobacillus sp. PS3-34 TaxID=3070678 RepID=UPI0027DFF195|nr:hypothetical protein [Neobacillus sp. PS3-34]WML49512.1 hypothetical protein RCG23_05855 [Neobacillus sp. PS3-34]
MITLSSIDELKATKEAIEKLKKDYPNLFEKLLDIVNLTRAFQFKYQYMGCLIMNEDPGQNAPNFVYGSVLRLYKKELQKLKDAQDSEVLKQIFSEFRNTGYAKISLLILGMKPESLVGSSSIR